MGFIINTTALQSAYKHSPLQICQVKESSTFLWLLAIKKNKNVTLELVVSDLHHGEKKFGMEEEDKKQEKKTLIYVSWLVQSFGLMCVWFEWVGSVKRRTVKLHRQAKWFVHIVLWTTVQTVYILYRYLTLDSVIW